MRIVHAPRKRNSKTPRFHEIRPELFTKPDSFAFADCRDPQTARRRNGYRCAKRQGKPNFTNPYLSLQHGHFRDFALAARRARLHPVHREP
jgi:hypothetical protein